MNIIGIIVEYNPFHNGHLYHLNKVKELYPDSIIIAVMSGNFTQRGDASIINKWDKTAIALHYGVDIVIELPYPFATQSADIFARGSIEILKELNADALIFGSESNDIDLLMSIANMQLSNKQYDDNVKMHMSEGISYPKALSNSLEDISSLSINTPNDILGIAYIKEIIRQKASIKPVCIKRTNDYNSKELTGDISSASSIRSALKNKINIKKYVPEYSYKYLSNNLFYIENYFPYLKYKILSEINCLNKYQTVDEGIENRIKRYIIQSASLEELINKIKTKRYTYNKIRRMLTHILNNFTKEDALKYKDIRYIRLLGFSNNGKSYLNKIKKKLGLPLITKYSDLKDDMLNFEFETVCVYASILDEFKKKELIELEYKSKPIKN